MAMNELTIEQISTIANSVLQQASGGRDLANVNTSDFTSVATAT